MVLFNNHWSFGGLFSTNYYQNGEMLDNGQKLYHDRYHVYVNDEFVGDKVLLTENNRISDLEGYLRDAGFKDFKATLEGGHYLISSENRLDSVEMKNHLASYLRIR